MARNLEKSVVRLLRSPAPAQSAKAGRHTLSEYRISTSRPAPLQPLGRSPAARASRKPTIAKRKIEFRPDFCTGLSDQFAQKSGFSITSRDDGAQERCVITQRFQYVVLEVGA